MSLSDMINEINKQEEETRERNQNKEGDYTSDLCPNCHRSRIMLGDDKKRRCEKCAWCIEYRDYDYEYLSYIK